MLGDPDDASRGLSKFGWFSALNISARNCRLNLSVNSKRLPIPKRSEEHTSELQSLRHLVCRLLLEKKKQKRKNVSIGKHQMLIKNTSTINDKHASNITTL